MTISKIDPAGLDVGQIGGRKNLIINGAMQVAQRGTSSATTSGYATVDRFRNSESFVDQLAVTQSQSTDAPDGFRTSYKMDVTTAESAIDANDLYNIQTRLEANSLQQLAYGTSNAQSVALSFWVKSNVTGTYSVLIFQGDSNRGITSTYTINSANTWEQKTITFSGDSSGTINNDSGVGLYLVWHLLAGSDYTGTDATSWVSTNANNAYGHTAQWGLSTSDDFYLTGVQLEVGDVATPFEHRSYGEELALCQRYYTKVTVDSANDSFCVGLCDGAGNATGDVFFPVTMRVAPTALEQTGTLSDYEIRKTGSTITCNGTPDYIRASQFQSTVSFNATGLTTGQAALLRAATTSAYLAWSAEL